MDSPPPPPGLPRRWPRRHGSARACPARPRDPSNRARGARPGAETAGGGLGEREARDEDDRVIGVPLFERYDEVKRYFKPILCFEKLKDLQDGECSDSDGDMCAPLNRYIDDEGLSFLDEIEGDTISPSERKSLYAPVVERIKIQQQREEGRRRREIKEKLRKDTKNPRDSSSRTLRKRRPPNIDKIADYLEGIEKQEKKRSQKSDGEECGVVRSEKVGKKNTIYGFLDPSSIPTNRANSKVLFNIQFGKKRQDELLELEKHKEDDDESEDE